MFFCLKHRHMIKNLCTRRTLPFVYTIKRCNSTNLFTTFDLPAPPKNKWDFIQYKKKKKKVDDKIQPLDKEELEEASKQLKGKIDVLPKVRDARVLQAWKEGKIGPFLDKLVAEKAEGFENYYIYPKDDPHFRKATQEILGPLEETLEEKNRALLEEETDYDKFFEEYDMNLENCNWLIRAQAAQNKMELAIDTFHRMKKDGLKPDKYTYTAVIHACAIRRDALMATKFLKMMNQEGIEPPLHAYAGVVYALTRAKLINEAFDVVQSMMAHQIQPDQVIHSMLIDGCIKTGDLTRAWNHFKEMMSIYGIEPDEICYSILINACAKGHQVEKAIMLYEEMEQKYMFPTEVTFNTLMHACCMRDDTLHRVPEMYDRLETFGYKPNIYTFNILIYWCGRTGSLDKLMKILDAMQEFKVKPNEVTYNSYFSALGKCQPYHSERQEENIKIAMILYEKMKKDGMPITAFTLNGVLSVYTYALRLNRAQQFFDNEYKAMNMLPDKHSYTLLINMYSRAKRFEKSLALIEEMKNNGLKPTYAIFKTLAFAYCKDGQTQNSLKVLKRMHEEEGYYLKPSDIVAFKAKLAGSRDMRVKRRQEEEDDRMIEEDLDKYLDTFY